MAWNNYGYGYGQPRGQGRGAGYGRGGMGRGGGWRGQGGGPPMVSLPAINPPAPGAIRVAAMTTTPQGLEAPLAPHYRRAPYIVIIDIINGRPVWITSIPNPVATTHGGGSILAQWLASNGVKYIVSGHIGPSAARTLVSLGVTIRVLPPGTRVGDALRQLGLLS